MQYIWQQYIHFYSVSSISSNKVINFTRTLLCIILAGKKNGKNEESLQSEPLTCSAELIRSQSNNRKQTIKLKKVKSAHQHWSLVSVNSYLKESPISASRMQFLQFRIHGISIRQSLYVNNWNRWYVIGDKAWLLLWRLQITMWDLSDRLFSQFLNTGHYDWSSKVDCFFHLQLHSTQTGRAETNRKYLF